MPQRASERSDGSGAPLHAALHSGAVQSAALKSGAVQSAASAKRYLDHGDNMPNSKRSCTGDTSQVAQDAASGSGASCLVDGWFQAVAGHRPLQFNVWKLLDPLPQTENAAGPRRLDDGSFQPDKDPGDAPQPSSLQIEKEAARPRNALVHGVASAIEQDLRAYCDSREDGEALVQAGLKQLRLLVSRKAKFPVDEHLWIPGAAPPGEQQYVEALVSETLELQHTNAHLLQQRIGDGSAQAGDPKVDGAIEWGLG